MLNIYVCNTWRQLKSPFTVDSSNQNFRYSHESDKPHAVTKVTPSTNFPNAISAADCLTEYNVFNQPTRIAEGDAEILLEYGADNQRVKAVFKRNGQVERTLYYINANYEKEVEADGVTTHYNYVYGATGLAAICVRRNGIDSMYYVHPDRLGSYTHITNANKQVIRNLHFDPWGNVKTDTDWKEFARGEPGELAGTFRFPRGFTGHEHYADLKIINMNGRLYDPVIARFFSPDNFVQAPEFTQSYNRYSYCLNNPLQWVDPSGELFGDYFDQYGVFLGTDGIDDGKIHIINRDFWNQIKDNMSWVGNDGVRVISRNLASDQNGGIFSNKPSEANLSDDAIKKIVAHYNTTKYPLQKGTDGALHTDFNQTEGSSYSVKLTINISQWRLQLSFLDNYYDIKSSYDNEIGHMKQCKELGIVAFNNLTSFQRESYAVDYQQAQEIYAKTSAKYKEVVNANPKLYKKQ